MKVIASVFVAGALLVLGSIAQASTAQPDFKSLGFSSEAEMQNYLSIVDVKVTTTPIESSEYAAVLNPSQADASAIALGGGLLDTLGPVLMAPENPAAWVAFGKKAWEVVVANRPVVNVQTARVTVLPNDKKLWAQMEGWRGPRGTAYTIQAVNGFGVTVVNQKYTVSFNYGGSLNGKGRYLANATIIPSTIEVSWGYTLNSSVEVGQVLNAGTVESPIPAVDMQLKYNTKTILKEAQGIDSFYIKGDGSLSHVSR
jgi:hypothetical protein